MQYFLQLFIHHYYTKLIRVIGSNHHCLSIINFFLKPHYIFFYINLRKKNQAKHFCVYYLFIGKGRNSDSISSEGKNIFCSCI